MAMPKKGSRKIVVNDTEFRWRLRHKPTYMQSVSQTNLNFSVELYSDPQSVLHVQLDQKHPQNWLLDPSPPVKPSDVESYINSALKAGWDPHSKKNFEFELKE